MNAIKLACIFHELYEKHAPNYGYETREETRVFNASTPNGKLMIAVCREIDKMYQAELAERDREIADQDKMRATVIKELATVSQQLAEARREIERLRGMLTRTECYHCAGWIEQPEPETKERDAVCPECKGPTTASHYDDMLYCPICKNHWSQPVHETKEEHHEV